MHTNGTDIPRYTLEKAAGRLGISVHTLRSYERAGLILPHEKVAGRRMYSDLDLERLLCIRRAINQDKIGIAGIQRIQALIPCWDVIGCSSADRENCEAYRSHTRGCWAHRHTENICAGRDCRSCEVYIESVDCSKIKEHIINATGTHERSL